MQTRSSTGKTPDKRAVEREGTEDQGAKGAFEARKVIARLNREEPQKVLAIAKHSGFLDAQYAAIAAIHADGFSLDLGDAYTASKVKWDGEGKVSVEEGCRRMELLAAEACHAIFRIGLLEIFIVAMMAVVLPAVSLLPPEQSLYVLEPVRSLGLFIFQSQAGLQWVLGLAWLAHLVEGTAALMLAAQLGCSPKQVVGWFLAVFLLGFPCMRHLLALRSAAARRKVA